MKQLSLFSQPSLNIGKKFKEQLALSAKESGFSREELLARINDLAERYGVRMLKGNGRKLTMATLEQRLNPEAAAYLPGINAIVVLCAALRDMEPLNEMVAPLGGVLIEEDDVKMLAWAKEYHRAKAAQKRMRKLEKEL